MESNAIKRLVSLLRDAGKSDIAKSIGDAVTNLRISAAQVVSGVLDAARLPYSSDAQGDGIVPTTLDVPGGYVLVVGNERAAEWSPLEFNAIIVDSQQIPVVDSDGNYIGFGETFAQERHAAQHGIAGVDTVYIDASQTNSGVFVIARIPDLPASQITSGQLALARLPDDVSSLVLGIAADVITSGLLDAARIPDLPASKITSGVLAAARVPNLPASKITSGYIAEARLRPVGSVYSGIVPYTSGLDGRVLMVQADGSADWETSSAIAPDCDATTDGIIVKTDDAEGAFLRVGADGVPYWSGFPLPAPTLTADESSQTQLVITASETGLAYELDYTLYGGYSNLHKGTDRVVTHTGLSYGTPYQYKARSFIGDLVGDYSGVYTFTTAAPPAVDWDIEWLGDQAVDGGGHIGSDLSFDVSSVTDGATMILALACTNHGFFTGLQGWGIVRTESHTGLQLIVLSKVKSGDTTVTAPYKHGTPSIIENTFGLLGAIDGLSVQDCGGEVDISGSVSRLDAYTINDVQLNDRILVFTAKISLGPGAIGESVVCDNGQSLSYLRTIGTTTPTPRGLGAQEALVTTWGPADTRSEYATALGSGAIIGCRLYHP